MMMAETGTGVSPNRSLGAPGLRAIWQWTDSIGSEAENGSEPVAIW